MHPDLAITPHPGFLAELPSRAGHLLTGLGYEGMSECWQTYGAALAAWKAGEGSAPLPSEAV